MTSDQAVSPARRGWARLKAHPLALPSLWFLGVLVIAVIVGPWFSPYGYASTDLKLSGHGPTWHHWLGTDLLGRDLLTRLLYGGRVSFAVALCATSVSLVIGVVYGAVAGSAGGWLDSLLMRVVDILYALPFTVFVILLMVFFGRDFILLFVAIGAVSWLTMARIVRGQVQALRHLDFISASQALGASRFRVLFRHLIPNALGPVIAYTTLMIPGIMMFEGFLSFIGLGVQPPMSSWGSLLNDGVREIEEYPWLMIFPGLLFSGTLLAFNFLGDALRDVLDPKGVK
jgi:oligopeptide transport system permease protein